MSGNMISGIPFDHHRLELLKGQVMKGLSSVEDVKVLERIMRILEDANPEEVIDRGSEGGPITKMEMETSLNEAKHELDRGEVMTIEELVEEAKGWD